MSAVLDLHARLAAALSAIDAAESEQWPVLYLEPDSSVTKLRTGQELLERLATAIQGIETTVAAQETAAEQPR